MPTIQQNINCQALNLIHMLHSTKKPAALYKMYKNIDRPQRAYQPLYPLYEPKTKPLKTSLFFNYTQVYNALSLDLRRLPKDKFKNQIKLEIRDNQYYHSIPNSECNNSDHSD